jgi:hypothetical protein
VTVERLSVDEERSRAIKLAAVRLRMEGVEEDACFAEHNAFGWLVTVYGDGKVAVSFQRVQISDEDVHEALAVAR